MRRAASSLLLGGAGVAALLAFAVPRPAHGPGAVATSAPEPPTVAPDEEPRVDAGKTDRLGGRALKLPSGVPAALSCRDARQIVAQARAHLASAPGPVDPKGLADATVDWLDPHGLWSASPDAPLAKLLERRGADLVRELEARDGGRCTVAEEAGTVLAAWIAQLAPAFDEALAAAQAEAPADAFRLASESPFEDRAVDRPARELARDLGHRVGVVAHTFGAPLGRFAEAARSRFVPDLGAAQWGRALLAAAVRAYVPQIDPHGGWAPLDEETSLYEVDLEVSPPRRLWDHMLRTAIGVRMDSGPLAPLAERDLVLEIASVPTAGLSVEQLEQLAILDDGDDPTPRSVVVLRDGEGGPRTLEIPPLVDRDTDSEASGALPADRVAYGDGDALVVPIGDVPDDLGDVLATTIAHARSEQAPRAILLDLRGNGGGSTDGANAALSLFLPGATLFPMRRRDGVIEIERAPEPPETDRWTGPVAALVDGDTASAAEMIAGALAAYRRGVVVGSRTYGKGCAQEYLDDEPHEGVLRLTTLVYALPDGSAVQRVGLSPTLQLGLAPAEEREASLARSLEPWRGPDVRERSLVADVPWPSHHGHVGPCKDETVCRALRALGTTRAATARGVATRAGTGR